MAYLKLSVEDPSVPDLLELEGLLTLGSPRGRTVGEPVGGIFQMDNLYWLDRIRYHILNTRPGTEFEHSSREMLGNFMVSVTKTAQAEVRSERV
jgi:hypothetical protein